MVDYFSRSYAEARQKFCDRAAQAEISVTTYENPAVGPSGETLATDVARLGPADAERVLILESGLHGPEGYPGSALQLAAFDWVKLAPDGDVALLLVHGINPWGYAWTRRGNEDNIDLNRHFIDWDAPGNLDNPGFVELADALLPTELSDAALAEGDAVMDAYRAQNGEKAFRRAIKSGQYSHPTNLFYGGLAPTWSAQTVARIAEDHLRQARFAGLIDVHTGLGPFGFGECLNGTAPESDEGLRASAWYGAVAHTKSPKTDYAGSAASILDGYKRAAPWPVWTPIGLEFGTRDDKTVRDSIRRDGWLHLNGGMDNPRAAEIKRGVIHAFYPDEPEWRAAVLERGREVVEQGLAGIAGQC